MVKYVSYNIVFQEIPDEVTLAITISNCPNSCKGCHSPQLREDIGDVLTETVLAGLIEKYCHAITCVCFMGGDSEVDSVQQLARFVHESSPLKTAWYSGRKELPKNNTFFDYVKLGAYIEKLGGLSSKSTNQRLYKIVANRPIEDITSKFNTTLH